MHGHDLVFLDMSKHGWTVCSTIGGPAPDDVDGGEARDCKPPYHIDLDYHH